MAAVTAHITSPDVTLTSKRKGEIGNFIKLKQIIDPAGATGATTVSVSGLEITVKLKNTSGTTITATAAEVLSALSGSTDAQALCTVVLTAAQTGANTGSAYTGSGGVFVAGASGAEGTSTIVYDDLAALTGAGWKKMSGNGIDVVERIRGDGTLESQQSVSATGAAGAVLAAGRTQDRRVRKGLLGPMDF